MAHYRAVGPAVELPAALEDLAVVLAACGRDEEARAALNEAVSLYDDLQARWDIRRAEGRLRPYGIRRGACGRREQRAVFGWEALTPNEPSRADMSIDLASAYYVADGTGQRGSRATTATRSLWGRQRERAALSRLLCDVRSGRGRVLVLRGEPGMGKTALLEDLCARADDVVLIRGAGVESEAELAFAGLHQMCSQMIREKLDLLPDPQREAIRVAFGESSGGPPNPFLLGLAVLNRLADAAAEQPVLCLVDDAQWLDRATAQTLAFVARHLDAEAVGIVFAVRGSIGQFDGLPELVVSGLAPEDARALLATALAAPVDEAVRERFIAETQAIRWRFWSYLAG